MPIEDFNSWLGERLGEEDLAEATAFYNDQMQAAQTFREGAEVRQREYEDRVGSLTAQISELKGKNYDLLMRIPADTGSQGADPQTDDGDDSNVTIDDLFERKDN